MCSNCGKNHKFYGDLCSKCYLEVALEKLEEDIEKGRKYLEELNPSEE